MKILDIIDGKRLIVNKDNDVYRYYLDYQFIGVCDTNSMEENILFIENESLSNEEKEKIMEVVNSREVDEYLRENNKYNLEQIQRLKKELNIDENKEIKKVIEIDLDQKIQEKDEKETREDDDEIQLEDELEESDKEIEHEDEEKKDKHEDADEKKQKNNVNARGIDLKQEMDLSNKITDMENLRQLLDKEGKIPKDKKYTKLAIVESDEIGDIKNSEGKSTKENTTRYQFVLVANDNTITPIDLEQDQQEGDNPTEVTYQTKRDGTVVENSVLSRYKIGEGSLAIDNEMYGEIKVYYSPRKTIGGEGIEGNKSLDIEMETDNVWEIDKEERDLAGKYNTGYRSVEEGYKEAKLHKEIQENGGNCEGVKTLDVDGKYETKSHNHVVKIQDAYIEVCAKRILEEYPDLADTYNLKDIETKLSKEIKGKEYLSKQELIEDLDTLGEKMEEEAKREHEFPGVS